MLDLSLLTRNHTIAVALSGGKDSVCLLHMLLSVKDELKLTIKAVNVEHGIRGESSLRDTEFCKRLCENLGVPIKIYSVNAPDCAQRNRTSEETAARILRYKCFGNALIDGFCDEIATAHHAADAFETTLFNLFRGSSAKGVCGICEKASDGKIIRPLIKTTKEEIDAYVEKNKLAFVTDETNFSDEYSRNYLRNVVIPAIKERFPSAEKATLRFSDILREEDEFLDRLAKEYIVNDCVLFCDDVLFRRACLIAMKKQGFTADYESVHLDALCKLKASLCGAVVCLKNGLKAYRTHDGVVFTRDNVEKLPEIPFGLGTFTFGNFVLTIEKTDRPIPGELCFDLDKLPYNTVIRGKRDGDVIKSFGGKTKKLKKYLGDKKIEARISTGFPLIAEKEGNEVFAVCPIDIGEKIKIDNNTRSVAKITCTPNVRKTGEDLNA